ncbi:fasciclin domain-containing protein [Aquimarina gracilis]|uniref:Fasciclin domain-containing protein n=1 Tax=Aquimarina gracilis TaxID=874422 RepID=A0ABU5ZT77_9FLAO|nr:fasciclin domain-containing protein [Aquimarina gracilis]MEB3344838.1 fasciclin domain-containing protein [Aquimarina gracilis]
MKFQNLFKTLLIILSVVIVSSCSDDDDTTFDENSTTIAQFVANNPNYSSLLAALEKAELVETLSSTTGSFTVFAPNNAAFDAFLTDLGVTLDDLTKEDLTPILLNHVIGSEVTSSQLSTGYVSNESGVSTYINTSSGVVINGDVTVTTADIDQSNGVIHAVDKVIAVPTLLDFVTADPDLSSLGIVATADVAAALSGDTTLTLLAPTDAAFGGVDLSGLSDDEVENTLLNHVIAGENLSSGLATGYGNTLATYGGTDNNLSIYINTSDGVTFNGTSSVQTADVVASNGVMHIVNAVITLPTVVTFAVADADNFSTLVAALTDLTPNTDFAQILSTTGEAPAPFTVFAPTNTAFAAITVPDNEDDIVPILNYHVVGGQNVRSTDLVDGTVETLNGDVTINASAPSVQGGGNDTASNIIVVDVQAINGVIHAIDQVLLPPTMM